MFLIPHPREFIMTAGEENQVQKRRREYHGCGVEYYSEQKGKQYHLTYNAESIGKNIK